MRLILMFILLATFAVHDTSKIASKCEAPGEECAIRELRSQEAAVSTQRLPWATAALGETHRMMRQPPNPHPAARRPPSPSGGGVSRERTRLSEIRCLHFMRKDECLPFPPRGKVAAQPPDEGSWHAPRRCVDTHATWAKAAFPLPPAAWRRAAFPLPPPLWGMAGVGGAGNNAQSPRATPTEERALAFLVREVPRWQRENKCHSCHNNGDAARALFLAMRLERHIDKSTVEETTRWLASPNGWEHNGGEGPFNDHQLARLQFTLALSAALDAGLVANRTPLLIATEKLIADQNADGSWPVAGESVGSPVDYGRTLGTTLAREVLHSTDAHRYKESIRKADRWLLDQKPRATVEAAAILLRTDLDPSPRWIDARRHAVELLRSGQSSLGGWGPYRTSPPETFDTALALLALARSPEARDAKPIIARGRSFLDSEQRPDGSWPATTRPTGGDSYAQRLSTTGWATMALLATAK
jgi:hypothetical protein